MWREGLGGSRPVQGVGELLAPRPCEQLWLTYSGFPAASTHFRAPVKGHSEGREWAPEGWEDQHCGSRGHAAGREGASTQSSSEDGDDHVRELQPEGKIRLHVGSVPSWGQWPSLLCRLGGLPAFLQRQGSSSTGEIGSKH